MTERENIVPGSVGMVTADLVPGDYRTVCGQSYSPRGILHVAAAATGPGADSKN